MKYTLFALSLITLFSCNKNEDPKPTSPAPSVVLNTTETALVGKWYLENITDSTEWRTGSSETTGQDYGPYTNNNYIEFASTDYSGGSTGNELNAYDATGAKDNQTFGSHIILKGDTWWYYDDATSKLIIQKGQYNIVTLNSTTLIFKYEVTYTNDPNKKKEWKTYYLHK